MKEILKQGSDKEGGKLGVNIGLYCIFSIC